jgi:hypothetical protein
LKNATAIFEAWMLKDNFDWGKEPCNCVTNFIEHDSLWKDDGRSAIQEISASLEPEYSLRCPNQPVVDRMPTQKNPASALISCSFNTHCNSPTFTNFQQRLRLPSAS